MTDSNHYNIAIIGKTGVGKSSLINYLHPEAKAETGIGRPVTKNGFHPYKFNVDGKHICIFDSWGLEAGKEDVWILDLDRELKVRGIDKPSQEWFHSVFYCIGAECARIQGCDLKIINKFKDLKYPITIILTKADGLSEGDMDKFINSIKQQLPSVKVIPVCSENKITRVREIKAFGKEAVEKQALLDFFEALVLRIPEKCEYSMTAILDKWVSDARRRGENEINIFSGFTDTHKEIINQLNDSLKKLQSDVLTTANSELKNAITTYSAAAKHLGHGIATGYQDNLKFSSSNNANSGWFDGLNGFFEKAAFTIFLPFGLPIFTGFLLFTGKKQSLEALEGHIQLIKSKMENNIAEKVLEIKGSLVSLKYKIEREII